MTPTPNDLLLAARRILDDSDRTTTAGWARGAALLTRQAIEAALADFWRARSIDMADRDFTAQLVALRFYVDDPGTARLAHQTWSSLSNACHHHAYDLAPTAAELRGWLGTVTEPTRPSRRMQQRHFHSATCVGISRHRHRS